jgi:hypothetical protein
MLVGDRAYANSPTAVTTPAPAVCDLPDALRDGDQLTALAR